MVSNAVYITKLVDLYDVTGPWTTTGQIPMYDQPTGTFVPGTIPVGENFAIANLTFDANRMHNTAGFSLDINTDNGVYAESWFYMTTNVSQFGYDQSYLELGGSQVNLYAGGTQILYAIATGIGVGASPDANAKFDVRATNALSTHYPIRARNSADTFNLFNVTGDGQVWSNGKAGIATNTNYGQNALEANTTGTDSAAFGRYALAGQTTGTTNTAIGRSSQQYNNVGSYNVSLGFASLMNSTQNNYTGVGNIGIGYSAGQMVYSGSYNTIIGYASGSGLTTGSGNTLIGNQITTAAASTTNTVVLADGSANTALGVALWKDPSNFVGFGYSHLTDTLGAKVDIKALGALQSNIALRVRNSDNNANIFQVSGDGTTNLYGYQTAQSLEFSKGSGNDVYISHYSQNTLPSNLIIRNAPASGGYGGSVPAICFEGPLGRTLTIARNIVAISDTIPGTLQTGYNQNAAVFGMKNALAMPGATDPTGAPTDHFGMYAKDIVAGNSAPHFITEAGDIVKLFKGAAVADAAGGAIIDIEARAAINALLARFRVTGGNGQIAD